MPGSNANGLCETHARIYIILVYIPGTYNSMDFSCRTLHTQTLARGGVEYSEATMDPNTMLSPPPCLHAIFGSVTINSNCALP